MADGSRNFAVIGLGTFGTTVAKELARFDEYVIGIDTDERSVAALADQITHAVIADARDEEALREAGVADCDVALIAIGEDLEANVLAAINARMLGVQTIWAKAISRTHHRILSKIGVDRVILPEEEVGLEVAQVLHNPNLRSFLGIGNGYYVVIFQAPQALAGKRLSELGVGTKIDVQVVCAMRGTDFVGVVGEDPQLAEGDKFLLLGRRAELRNFAALI